MVAFVVVSFASGGAAFATAQPLCHPALTIGDVHFSEMTPPTLERTWTATVSVDTSGCQPNVSGSFDIAFTRLSETAPDLPFRQRYAWRSPSVAIAATFAADEAVQQFAIDNVTACACPK